MLGEIILLYLKKRKIISGSVLDSTKNRKAKPEMPLIKGENTKGLIDTYTHMDTSITVLLHVQYLGTTACGGKKLNFLPLATILMKASPVSCC